jgi:hypothetical protein
LKEEIKEKTQEMILKLFFSEITPRVLPNITFFLINNIKR